jgi:hypothetical protein
MTAAAAFNIQMPEESSDDEDETTKSTGTASKNAAPAAAAPAAQHVQDPSTADVCEWRGSSGEMVGSGKEERETARKPPGAFMLEFNFCIGAGVGAGARAGRRRDGGKPAFLLAAPHIR